MNKPKNEDTPRGFAFALTAYVLWGFLPLYLKLIEHIPVLEVLAHRVLWSVPVAGLILLVLGRTGEIGRVMRDPRALVMGCVTATLVSINWGTYVWAVTAGRALDGALGYYINPIFSVFLGALLLGERLNRLQWWAVGLAALAVAFLTYETGSLPWPALVLTFSWGFYAYFKRSLPIGPNQGFLLEVMILLPVAVGYLVWLAAQGGVGAELVLEGGPVGGQPAWHFVPLSFDMWMLMGCGIITAVPLMLYANGAKGLRLATIGIMQYIAPTMIMLIAVFVFEEPFGTARAVAFPLIWAALALYTYAMFRGRKS